MTSGIDLRVRFPIDDVGWAAVQPVRVSPAGTGASADGHFEMSASVPAGMRLELSRARRLPGAQDETDRWMDMLHDRYEECLDTLGADRMAFEATFRHTDADGYRVDLPPQPLRRGDRRS